MSFESGQPDALKRYNRMLLMKLIEQSEGISRASLARQANLSRTTVSHITNELLETEVLREVGDSYTGGRRAALLQPNLDAWHALGAELGSHAWQLALINSGGKVIRQTSIEYGAGGPRQVLNRLAEGVQKLSAKSSGRILPALGVAVPGLVDMDTGTIIRRADDPTWVNVPVQAWLELDLRMPVKVINRHKASGLAEVKYGAGTGLPEVIYIGIDSGISGAVFSKGTILYGASYGSGEIGHMTVLPDGPMCSCGNNGCLQTLASGQAIIANAAALVAAGRHSSLGDTPEIVRTVSAEKLCAAARAGDAVSADALRAAGRYLGIVIAGLINVLNPSMVVLGGTVGLVSEPLLQAMQAEVRRRALTHALLATRITVGQLGHQAGAIGAASLVLERKLDYIFNPAACE